MKRTIISCLLLAGLLLSLAACQAAPDKEVVVSKNDGTFEQAIGTDAGENGGVSLSDGSAAVGSTSVHFADSFTSTDGKITYTINAQVAVPTANLPIVQVRPMVINGPKAKQIAQAVFGSAPLYEKTNEKTRGELEDIIILLSNWTSDAAIRNDYGQDIDDTALEDIRANRQAILDNYKAAYAQARDVVPKEECQFRFYEQFTRYSIDGTGAYGDATGFYDEIPYGESYDLQANAEMDGIPYIFWVNNREADDFRNHSFSVFVDLGNVTPEVENEYKRSVGLYSDTPATSEQLAQIEQKAASMIEGMGIGQWQIHAEVQHSGDSLQQEQDSWDYYVVVRCLPVYEGITVTHQDQLFNMKSKNAFASNYYYEELTMMFSNDGRLLDIHYDGALELVQVVNANVPVMSTEEMQQRIREQLALSDLSEYWQFNEPNAFEKYYPNVSGSVLEERKATLTAVRAEIEIDQVEIGLARIKIKDNNSDFYLVPSVTLRGHIKVYNAAGTELVSTEKYFYLDDIPVETILGLNLVDGTVLVLKNPEE